MIMAFQIDLARLLRTQAFWFLILGYVLFITIGGAIFMALEQPEERSLRAQVQVYRTTFLDSNHCVSERSLDNLLKKVLFAGKREIAVLKSDGDDYNFDFTSSLFFVTTFLTTTGYGTTMPLSDEGRVFCMLYCLLGIPFTLLFLSCVTHALLPWVTHAPIHHLQTFWSLSHNRAALLYSGLLASCTATFFLLLPAASLCLLEREWSFLESLYYCFTSLSTIGLGDYLPGMSRSPTVRRSLEFATSCYLVLGLVVLLVVLETFWELQQVQALVRFFAGPQECELKGFGLDELVLSGDSGPLGNQEEEFQYRVPISIISPSLPVTSTTLNVEPAAIELSQAAASPGKGFSIQVSPVTNNED